MMGAYFQLLFILVFVNRLYPLSGAGYGNDKRSLINNPCFPYSILQLDNRQSNKSSVDSYKSLEYVSTMVPTRSVVKTTTLTPDRPSVDTSGNTAVVSPKRIHLSELNSELKQKIPPGYEVYGYEKVQNQMFERYPSIYNYRKCNECGYSIPAYGKPYSILFEPTIVNTVPNNTILMVCTQPSEGNLRDLFRRATEKRRHQYNITYFFALTKDPKIAHCTDILKEEQSRYHDLLVFDHPNTYHNLILTVFFSFHYLNSLVLSSRYIVKTDADVALNIPLLMQLIYQKKYMERRTVYLGDCMDGSYNTRNKRKKNYVSPSIIQGDRHYSFARGGLYVMSRESLTPLLIGVRHLSFLTHMEDVTVGTSLYRMGIRCERPRNNWIAPYGCNPKQCRRFVSIHPKESSKRVFYHRYFS